MGVSADVEGNGVVQSPSPWACQPGMVCRRDARPYLTWASMTSIRAEPRQEYLILSLRRLSARASREGAGVSYPGIPSACTRDDIVSRSAPTKALCFLTQGARIYCYTSLRY